LELKSVTLDFLHAWPIVDTHCGHLIDPFNQ